jgi:hypothetical protein
MLKWPAHIGFPDGFHASDKPFIFQLLDGVSHVFRTLHPAVSTDSGTKRCQGDVRLRVSHGAGNSINLNAGLQAQSVNACICASILERMMLSKGPSGAAKPPEEDKGAGQGGNVKPCRFCRVVKKPLTVRQTYGSIDLLLNVSTPFTGSWLLIYTGTL